MRAILPERPRARKKGGVSSPPPASLSHAPDRSWSLQTQRRRRTQRPRRPLCVKVGPFAGREQGWFGVSLLRHEPVLLRVFDRIAGFAGWTGSLCGDLLRRRGGVRGGAPPKQTKIRAAGCRWMPRSKWERLCVPAGLCVPFKHEHGGGLIRLHRVRFGQEPEAEMRPKGGGDWTSRVDSDRMPPVPDTPTLRPCPH